MIEVKEVLSKKDLKLFAEYPLKLYKDCPYYVPSLRSDELATFNPKKNFNLKDNLCKGFLCYKDGVLVGRIAGLINKKRNQIAGEKNVRFSRLECIDDVEVFKALLGAVESFGKQNGMEYMHGPWGFNDTDREGILTYGFDVRSTYATNYSYPYFHQRLEQLGFEKEAKWLEYRFVIPDKCDERIDKLAVKVKERYKIRDLAETMSIRAILKRYGDKMFDTLNEAYGDLDGYVPVEGKARQNVLKQFATIAKIRYVSFLVNEQDEVIGFGLVLPSIANALIKHGGRLFPFGFISVLRAINRPKELEMGLIGVKKSYRNSGVNAVIVSRIMRNILQDDISLVEGNPMLENNLSIQNLWKFAEKEIVKRRCTYKKKIQ